MSSTLRGYERHVSDYYVTPQQAIRDFLGTFFRVEAIDRLDRMNILDPACGGSGEDEASYVKVFEDEFDVSPYAIDIRKDSQAEEFGDYLNIDFGDEDKYDMVITNPPFSLAMEFIKKSLELVEEGGFVVMLLRLNFFGSKMRKPFFDEHMPKYTFIHHKRMSFLPRDVVVGDKTYKKGSTDSIEYAHFVWQKGYEEEYSKTYIV